jgi:ribosomal protein S18 acetylase RimI-like enzyme
LSAEAPVVIRQISPGEDEAVSALVDRVFHHDVAPLYSPEGGAEFLRYATASGLRDRQRRGHIVLVAIQQGLLAGMIELRGYGHISLLFVDLTRQREGIGRQLLREALRLCRAQPSPAVEITVNSSPNAVEAYRRFGFQPTGEFQVKNGIGFVPMSLNLEQADGA